MPSIMSEGPTATPQQADSRTASPGSVEETKTLARKLRNTRRWRKLSQSVRQESPWCRDPFRTHARQERKKPSESVHHIKPIGLDPSLAYSRGNLAAVCNRCHASLEAMERKGEGTEHLFSDATEAGGVDL